MRLGTIASLFFSIIFLSAAFFLGALSYVYHNYCIDFSALANYNPGKYSILLDDEGYEWARFGLDKREPIVYEQLPKHLIHAFLAAEDHQFFYHSGISCKGIARSLAVNCYYGRTVQGASTITQQLVKLLFFDLRKTFKRKIKEQLLALLVERQFTKEYIFQTYVNHIYFGCGIYGVQAAAQRFWGKPVQEISLDQAALLAGVIRSPGQYCPLLSPLSSEQRRNTVLKSMLQCGYISKHEYQEACKIPVKMVWYDDNVFAPHFKEALRVQLEGIVGKEKLYAGGLTIQTTLNRHTQLAAQRSFFDNHAKLKKINHTIDGGLVSLDTKTGGIKALIGGFDYNQSVFNRATQARRQVGSILKPLVYAAAIEAGYSLADTLIDEPFEYSSGGIMWRPHNYDSVFNGEMTRAWALSRSNNIVAIKTFLEVGGDAVVSLIKKCRLSGSIEPYPSLALGCIDAKVVQAAAMFNIFAHDGIYVKPYSIWWIKDDLGVKIYKHKPETERVISSRTAGQLTKTLTLGAQRVAQRIEKPWIDSEVIHKTGTTNESRTCWYVGSTPSLTTAVYVGCDDNSSLGVNVYPLRTAFPLWFDMNRKLRFNKQRFMYDPSLQEITINAYTGEPIDKQDPEAITIFV